MPRICWRGLERTRHIAAETSRRVSTTELIGLGTGVCPANGERPQTVLYEPDTMHHAARHDEQLRDRRQRSEADAQNRDPGEDPEPDREHQTERPHGQPPFDVVP